MGNGSSAKVSNGQVPASYTNGAIRPLSLDTNGALRSRLVAVVDPNNSATSGSGVTPFTGTATEVLGFASVSVEELDDSTSGCNTRIQFSQNATNWDDTLDAGSPGGSSNFYRASTVHARYLRVLVASCTSSVSTFRIQTILRPYPASGSAGSSLMNENVDTVPISGYNSTTALARYAATAKGVQPPTTTGYFMPTQAAHDSGRTYVTFTSEAQTITSGLGSLALTQNKGGTTSAGVNHYVPTNGKTLRCISATWCMRSGAAAANWVRVDLLNDPAGTGGCSTGIWASMEMEPVSTTSGTGSCTSETWPDGIEFTGNGTLRVDFCSNAAASTSILSGNLTCYEY